MLTQYYQVQNQYHFLSISYIKNYLILLQNVKYGIVVTNVTKKLIIRAMRK